MKYSVGVLIISDRAASGEREDTCLPAFQAAFSGTDFTIEESSTVSDSPDEIEAELKRLVSKGYSLVLTSGGTGCGPRDNTPEVTQRLLDKPTPGLDEAIRLFSREKTSNAMFSRAVSGVAGRSFIVNFPGSPTAVGEILEFLIPFIGHPLKLVAGQISDCREDMNQHD